MAIPQGQNSYFHKIWFPFNYFQIYPLHIRKSSHYGNLYLIQRCLRIFFGPWIFQFFCTLSNFSFTTQKILASYILIGSQYLVPIPIFLSCIAHCNTDKNVMHTVLSPIILSPPRLSNSKYPRSIHPPPDFRNKYFNYCHIAGTGTDTEPVTPLYYQQKIFLSQKILIFIIIVVSLAQILVAAGCLTNSDWVTNMWMEPGFTIHPLFIITNDEWWR